MSQSGDRTEVGGDGFRGRAGRLPFAKGQALGNDYLVVEAEELPWELTAQRIQRICDRHRGAGSDGFLVRHPGTDPFVLRIWNPDGSEAEKSGNGLRIFGAYLHARGLVKDQRFRVELKTDEVTMQVMGTTGRGELDIVAAMGRPNFTGAAAGFAPESGEALGYELDLGAGVTAKVNPLSLGNPHCVVILDALDRADFLRRAPALAVHPSFPAGTNVQFARLLGDDRLEAWIWERGAGETLASGSSACAVAAVARKLGLVTANEVRVEMPGGHVEIRHDPDGMIHLRGPAQIVYFAELPEDVVRAWGMSS